MYIYDGHGHSSGSLSCADIVLSFILLLSVVSYSLFCKMQFFHLMAIRSRLLHFILTHILRDKICSDIYEPLYFFPFLHIFRFVVAAADDGNVSYSESDCG